MAGQILGGILFCGAGSRKGRVPDAIAPEIVPAPWDGGAAQRCSPSRIAARWGARMTADPRFDGPGPDELWRAALAEGRFLIQRCRSCAKHRFPPALVCAACGAAALEWVPASGRGTVYASTIVREHEGGYNIALIELAEGARLLSRVDGIAPEAVVIGMPVAARIIPGAEPLVVFEPADRSAR